MLGKAGGHTGHQCLVGGQRGGNAGREPREPAVSSAHAPGTEYGLGTAAPLGGVCSSDDASESADFPGVEREREYVMLAVSDERKEGPMRGRLLECDEFCQNILYFSSWVPEAEMW